MTTSKIDCKAEQIVPSILECTDAIKRLRAEIATLRASLDEAFDLNTDPPVVIPKKRQVGSNWMAWAQKP